MNIQKNNNRLLGIPLPTETKQQTLENIKKYAILDPGFCHVVSLNPENLMTTQANAQFEKVVQKAQIRIIDGVGILLGAWVLGIPVGPRYPGVDLMLDLLKIADEERLRVMLIGGGPKVAEMVVNCQKRKFPAIEFFSLEGFADISNPTPEEAEKVNSIVAARRPHLVFVAFGSPAQELWIDENRHIFGKSVVMGVGGAFDYLSGAVSRPNSFLRALGVEWLFRLIRQPWRLKRQLKLPRFIHLIIKQKLKKIR